jgi:hypothetical protein
MRTREGPTTQAGSVQHKQEAGRVRSTAATSCCLRSTAATGCLSKVSNRFPAARGRAKRSTVYGLLNASAPSSCAPSSWVYGLLCNASKKRSKTRSKKKSKKRWGLRRGLGSTAALQSAVYRCNSPAQKRAFRLPCKEQNACRHGRASSFKAALPRPYSTRSTLHSHSTSHVTLKNK